MSQKGWTLILLVTLSMAGCRFGNHVSQPQTADPISGYYETQQSSFHFCATVTSQPNTVCKDGPNSLIPSSFAIIMTNPVVLYVLDHATGQSALLRPAELGGDGKYLPVFAFEDGTISGMAGGDPAQFWDNPTCFSIETLDRKGSWKKTQGPWTSGMEFKIPLAGRLEIKFTSSIRFDGNCSSDLQRAYECYQDVTKCGAGSADSNHALQDQLKGIFQPYIDTGCMTASDIPFTSTLSYDISYQ